MKKTWQAPQLIILVRSKPEEAILTGCKTESGQTGSPTYTEYMCDVVNDCASCWAIVSS